MLVFPHMNNRHFPSNCNQNLNKKLMSNSVHYPEKKNIKKNKKNRTSSECMYFFFFFHLYVQVAPFAHLLVPSHAYKSPACILCLLLLFAVLFPPFSLSYKM